MGNISKLNRQVLVSCTLGAGLLLASAPAVFAADPPANSQAGGSPTGQANSADSQAGGSPTGQANSADSQAGGSPTGQANSANGQATAADNQANAASNRANAQANPADNNQGGGNTANNNQGNQGKANQGKANQGKANQGQGNKGAAKAAPPGNNGTIKVDMDGLGLTRPNNEPQGGCDGVTIKFFNFDPNEVIDVAFSGQAPTRFGSTATRTVTAGGTGYTTSAFSFAEIVPAGAPAAQNGGWHVRVEANGRNHPAGVKTKVFWLRCASPTGVAGTTVEETTTVDRTAVAGTQEVQNQAQAATPEAPANPTPARRLSVLGVTLERSPAAKVAGTQQGRLTASPAGAGTNADNRARVLGTMVERSALARTGLDILQLATLGGLALLAGYAALRVSRRKTAASSSRLVI